MSAATDRQNYDEVDALGVAVDRFQPRADLFTWAKADLEQIGHSLAKSSNGIVSDSVKE
jgi:hypothetical protein